MLLKDLRLGHRIFVLKRNEPLPLSEVMPLFQLLRQYGPNTLLWIEQAGNGQPPGTVEVVREGLMKGYIERFAPYDQADTAVDASVWLPVCRQAFAVWAGMRE